MDTDLILRAIASLSTRIAAPPEACRTVNDALDRYARDHVTPALMRQRTIEWRTLAVRRLRPRVGSTPLDGRDFVAEAVAIAEDATLAHSGRRECCNTLARVLTLASGWWNTPAHAIPRRLVKNGAPTRARVLSGEQVGRFQAEGLDVLEARVHDSRTRRLAGAIGAVRFILATGLRVSEVAALEWANVDPEGRWIRVFEGVKGEPRYVVTGRVAAAIIDRQRPARGRYVFAGRRAGGHVTRRTVLATVHDAAELAGIGACWTHVLRHCWASAAVRLKVQPSHIQQALGWRSLAMISTYVHVGADELRESVDAVASAQIGGHRG